MAKALRFRRGLPARSIESDGYQFVELDTGAAEPCRLYDFEHVVATELDGRPLNEVLKSLHDNHNLELSFEQLEAFVSNLDTLGLLEPIEEQDQDQGQDRTTSKTLEETLEEGAPQDTADQGNTTKPTVSAAIQDESTAQVLAQPKPATNQWDEQEPTSIMDSVGSLLSVSRAKTDQVPILAAEAANARMQHTTENIATGVQTPRDEDAPAESPSSKTKSVEAGPAIPRFHGETAPEDIALSALDRTGPYGAPELLVDDARMRAPHAAAGAQTRRSRGPILLLILLLTLAGAFVVFRFIIQPANEAAFEVSTWTVQPDTVFHWFEKTTDTRAGPPVRAGFERGGKIARVIETGVAFKEGEILAMLESARSIEKQLERLRERKAYYEQALATMRAEGNAKEAARAEAKVEEKNRLIEAELDNLAPHVIRAKKAGTVAEVFRQKGETVDPSEPVLTFAERPVYAEFDDLQTEPLAFCVVRSAKRHLPCTFMPAAPNNASTVVELPPGTPEGQTVSLAKARFEGVFEIPKSAVKQDTRTPRVFVNKNGRADLRAILVVDDSGEKLLVAQGLDPGDAVIDHPPPGLTAQSKVRIVRDHPTAPSISANP